MSASDNQVLLGILLLLYKNLNNDPANPGVDRAIIQATLQIPVKQMDDCASFLAERNLVTFSGSASGKWTFAKITTDGIETIQNQERYADRLVFTQTSASQNAMESNDKAFKTAEPLNFAEKVADAFKQARDQLLAAQISVGEKEKIGKMLKSLEKEVLKAKKADLNSIQKECAALKKNAAWLSPTLAPILLESVRVILDLPASA